MLKGDPPDSDYDPTATVYSPAPASIATIAPQHSPSLSNPKTINRTPASSNASASTQPASTRSQQPSLASPPPIASEVNQLTNRGRSLITLQGCLGPHPAVVLVDCGATGSFVSSSYVRSHGLAVTSDATLIKLADGREQSAAGLLAAASVTIGSYTDTIDLTVTDLSGYDIILGMSWLHHYNPTIDWRGRSISFTDSAGRRHRLLKAPTGAAIWRPDQRKTQPFALNLISSKRLRRAYERKQIEFACLVYPHELLTESEASLHSIDQDAPIAQDSTALANNQHGPSTSSICSLQQRESVGDAVECDCESTVSRSRSSPSDADLATALMELNLVAPTQNSGFPTHSTGMNENHAKSRLPQRELHSRSRSDTSLSQLQLQLSSSFTTTYNSQKHIDPPFQCAHSTGEPIAASHSHVCELCPSQSCAGSQSHSDRSHDSSSVSAAAVSPLFFHIARTSEPIHCAKGLGELARHRCAIHTEAVSREPDALQACGGQIRSEGSSLLTLTQRQRPAGPSVQRVGGVNCGGGQGGYRPSPPFLSFPSGSSTKHCAIQPLNFTCLGLVRDRETSANPRFFAWASGREHTSNFSHYLRGRMIKISILQVEPALVLRRPPDS